jgi:nicotinamide riboside transporter PnuC
MKWLSDPETMAALTGILGALLLAFNNEFSRYGWPLFLVSNLGWIVFSIRGKFQKLLIQQLAFLATTLFGIWNAFFTKLI